MKNKKVLQIIGAVLSLVMLYGCEIRVANANESGQKIILIDEKEQPVKRYYSPDGKNFVAQYYDYYNEDPVDKPAIIYLNDTLIENFWDTDEPVAMWLDNNRFLYKGRTIYNILNNTQDEIFFNGHSLSNEPAGYYSVNCKKDKIAFVFYYDIIMHIYIYNINSGDWKIVFQTAAKESEYPSERVGWDKADNLYFDNLAYNNFTDFMIYKAEQPDYNTIVFNKSAALLGVYNDYLYISPNSSDEKRKYVLYNSINDETITIEGQFEFNNDDILAYYDPKKNKILLRDMKTNKIIGSYEIGKLLKNEKELFDIQYWYDHFVILIEDKEKHTFITYELS